MMTRVRLQTVSLARPPATVTRSLCEQFCSLRLSIVRTSRCCAAIAPHALRAGCWVTGALFQYPGAVLMTLAGVGAARVLEDPPPALRAAVAGTVVPSLTDPCYP